MKINRFFLCSKASLFLYYCNEQLLSRIGSRPESRYRIYAIVMADRGFSGIYACSFKMKYIICPENVILRHPITDFEGKLVREIQRHMVIVPRLKFPINAFGNRLRRRRLDSLIKPENGK